MYELFFFHCPRKAYQKNILHLLLQKYHFKGLKKKKKHATMRPF